MGKVLSLEVDLGARGDHVRKARHVMERGWASNDAVSLCLQLCLDCCVVACLPVGVFQLDEGCHQDFGDELPTVGSEAPACVGVEIVLVCLCAMLVLNLHWVSPFLLVFSGSKGDRNGQGHIVPLDSDRRGTGRPQGSLLHINAHPYGAGLARTRSMNERILPVSLCPLVSTPLLSSTPHGWTCWMAAATFSGVKPPASNIGASWAAARARVQSWVMPVPPQPGAGVSSRMRQATSRYALTLPMSLMACKRSALITGRARRWQNSGGSSPWSCTTCNPTCCAISLMHAASLLTNTPTISGEIEWVRRDNELSLFNLDSDNPARADKSALGAINRPLPMSGLFCETTSSALTVWLRSPSLMESSSACAWCGSM